MSLTHNCDACCHCLQDKDGSSKNPDLHFNRGNVYKYLEDYDEAAASFRAALALDPSLPAKDEVDGIEKHVQRVADLVTRKVSSTCSLLFCVATCSPLLVVAIPL